MFAAIRHTPYSRRRLSALGLALLLGMALSSDALWADPPAGGDKEDDGAEAVQGLFITVPNLIDSKAVSRVKTTTARFLQRPDHRNLKIVYDFNPDGKASGDSDYGPCHDLAKYLLGLQDITTIAFVHNDVTGHAVLPVLACKDVVLSADAKIGDVLRGQAEPLWKDQRQFYEDVATGRGRCPAIVLKMADKDMPVLEGTRKGAVWYIDQRREAEEGAQGFVPTGHDPVLPAGSVGLYTSAQATRFGLCNLIKESRAEVAEAYRLPPRSLHEDPLEGRTPVAWKIEVKGQVNGALKETLERRVRRAVANQANFLILQLECGGGNTQTALDLAEFLRDLKDDAGENPVMTVAYVTERAHDTATYLAMGCTEIVIEKQARLGGFERIAQESPSHQELRRQSLVGLAKETGFPVLLAAGMMDPDLEIHRVRSKTGPVQRQLLEGKDVDATRWIDEGEIKAPGEWLEVDSKLAEELGVAQLVVDGSASDPMPVIYARYGLERDRVHNAGPDWLDELASFLGHPLVSVFLVMIGIAGLVLELKMPGVGLPGVVAAVCFVLYFWAHSHLAGHLTMLALILFALGLILIGLEIFVVPGFGVTGISGVLLVVVSLALATLVKKPETTQEWLDFGTTLSKLGLGLVAAVIGAFVLAWYLPNIPYANRMVLAPPDGPEITEGEEGVTAREKLADLLGAIGIAATPLRPAGKVLFGEEYVDVVAEGSYVEAGARVQVVEIEGNRVVVKEAS